MASPPIPRGVWVLGLVSMCMDLSSELIHSLLPLYMALGLGASTLTIGIVEGIAEATALIVKVFSGVLSDFFRRRKPLVVLGYGLAALTKFIFPLASTLGWIVTARFADRVGKGIRGAPRDALIADLTPESVRGASFGLRQALDTVGAVGGPLLAIGAMAVFRRRLPGGVLGRRRPGDRVGAAARARRRRARTARSPTPIDETRASQVVAMRRRLGRGFAIVVAIAAVLTLARFSEAFLVLRAQDVGLAVGAGAVGHGDDVGGLRGGRRIRPAPQRTAATGPWLLSAGLVVLVASDLVLANAAGGAGVIAGAALWGLHMGLTQGLLAALVAAAAPADLRGTAFGVFNLVCGVALLVASVARRLAVGCLRPAVHVLRRRRVHR